MMVEANEKLISPRARDLGLYLGELPPGPFNAITDVPGVRVGHATVIAGDGQLVIGEGPVRTGVTAVIPHAGNVFMEKVPAAIHVINGFGKAVGLTQIEECGVLETPILLTNTLNVSRVADALIDAVLQHNPAIGITTSTVNPVVMECNDGYLNDIQGRHVRRDHVMAALRDAHDGPVAEGALGAGTGMTAFGWKGGIGSASRLVPTGAGNDYTLGVLVLANYGSSRDLTVGGWPVGRFLPDPDEVDHGSLSSGHDGGRARGVSLGECDGSVIIVIAADAPLATRQLRRVASRAVVGMVRTGSRLSHSSGDYAVAFSTAYRLPHRLTAAVGASGNDDAPVSTRPWPDDGPVMAGMLRAAGEATEEAILNAMLQARTMVGRDGHVRHALPVDEMMAIIRQFEGH